MKENETQMHQPDTHHSDDLDTLFAAARELTQADLSAADRFLAANAGAFGRGSAAGSGHTGRQRHALRLWAGTVLGLAAALSGLILLRPAPADLPASAAYSVYQSAIGEGW